MSDAELTSEKNVLKMLNNTQENVDGGVYVTIWNVISLFCKLSQRISIQKSYILRLERPRNRYSS